MLGLGPLPEVTAQDSFLSVIHGKSCQQRQFVWAPGPWPSRFQHRGTWVPVGQAARALCRFEQTRSGVRLLSYTGAGVWSTACVFWALFSEVRMR